MRHPQAVAVQAMWDTEPSVTAPGFDIAAAREQATAEGLREPKDPVTQVVDVDASGVPCRLYRPQVGSPLIVHLHGGGFVFGGVETHDAPARRLSNATGYAVLSVGYRLAPEHRFPAACDDVDTVVDWLQARGADSLGVDATRLSLFGDSAGGQLCTVAALRRQGFEAAVLVYPCVDPSGSHASYRGEDGGLTGEEMDWFWQAYAPEGVVDRANPELDVMSADLARLPPTLVITAEHDPLRDEGEALGAAIAAAGVPTVTTRYLGMIHGFFRHPELFDAGRCALDQVAGWLRRVPGTGSGESA